jgi:hypothetical protein
MYYLVKFFNITASIVVALLVLNTTRSTAEASVVATGTDPLGNLQAAL